MKSSFTNSLLSATGASSQAIDIIVDTTMV
jgi:hypothetical protein